MYKVCAVKKIPNTNLTTLHQFQLFLMAYKYLSAISFTTFRTFLNYATNRRYALPYSP